MTDEELTRWGRWVFDTCLIFGCNFETAGAVAQHFVEGLHKARTRR